MKQIKITILLVVLMSMTGLNVSAATLIDGIYYNLDDTKLEATVTKNSSKYSGAVVIPSSVTYNSKTYSVTSIGESAFYYCSGLTSVTIPNSVTSIGNYAFGGCYALNKVIVSDIAAWCGISFGSGYANPLYYAKHLYSDENTEITNLVIPSGVTNIGNSAFMSCSALTSVTIPNSVTSIGSSTFYNCTGLNSVTIPNSVINIGNYAFDNCFSLTSITIPNSVTSIGNYAFECCSGLTSITIPNNVTSIGGSAFNGCSGLTSIIVQEGNTKYDSRENCNAIIETSTNILIAGCQNTVIPSSVTSIGSNAFYGCSGLTSITIPNSVTSIGESVFFSCSSLSSVTIGNSVTSIGNYAFYNCSGLSSVTIGNSVTSIGHGVFSGCSGLNKVIVSDIAAWCGISFTGYGDNPLEYAKHLYSDENTEITDLVIPSGVKNIGSYAYEGCSTLTSVTIPASVTSIGDYAFYGCSSLTSVTMQREAPISITSDVFTNRTNAILRVPEGCKTEYKAANYWKEFKYIREILPPLPSNSAVVFADEKVKALCVGNWDRDDDGELSENEAAAVNDLEDIFKGNTSITSFNELSYFTALTSIGSSAFYGCTSLTSITIPYNVSGIGDSAFYGCTSLTSVTIPNSVTSIGNSAFRGLTGLKSIVIPASVESIGSNAFFGCNKLLDVVTLITSPVSIPDNAFSNKTYADGTLYVPSGTKSKYQVRGGWKKFVYMEVGVPAGIDNISNEGAQEAARYTLDGKRVATPQPGLNIVRVTDGSTRKVVVK